MDSMSSTHQKARQVPFALPEKDLTIRWQDKVFEQCKIPGIEAMIITNQFRWAGYVSRTADTRIPKQVFYVQLSAGDRSHNG